jgi:nucleotide-binding universal stress UspA family protein
VGCDGSRCADVAQAAAGTVAAALGSPLVLMHAHVAGCEPGDRSWRDFDEALHAAGRRVLDRARQRAPEEVETAPENLVGSPATVLGQRARAAGAGLLVVGARGCGGSLPGRTVERLALDPACPLMVVPPLPRPGAAL